MRVLVTGHRGFVGRHFYQWAQDAGHWVTGCDIVEGRRDSDCRVGFQGDAWADTDLLIHCAATIPAVDERHSNGLIVANDFSIDSLMFQWALRNRPGQVVVFSSSAAYPEHLQGREHYLTEDDIDLDDFRTPDLMYGVTKLVVELQSREARKQGIDVRVFRPFSGYGSDQSLNYPFPSFIQRARDHVSPFDIWGSGRQVRDFIHVEDVVNAVVAIIGGPDIGPVNLGWGRPTTMRELAEMCAVEAGYRPAYRVHGDKPEGSYFRCADVSLMRTAYTPKVTLEEGIRRALERS